MPLTVNSPTITTLNCPKCGEAFKYLVTPPTETYQKRLPNACPKCRWIFDDTFYESIRDKYPCLKFKSKKSWEKFYADFQKRNRGKIPKDYLKDVDLINQYRNKDLLSIGKDSAQNIKYGYVNPNIIDKWSCSQNQTL